MRVITIAATLAARLRAIFAPGLSAAEHMDAIDENELDQMLAWSICAQLAAVPASYCRTVPEELAVIFRAAKQLHPGMAAGAERRELD